MTVAKVILVDKAVITRLAYDHVEIAIEDETGHLHIRKYEQYYKTMYETQYSMRMNLADQWKWVLK
ncbi:unnamed protein product [Fusarium graminearum]|nr:unnamed protein product [Fusarium graminearum]